MSVGDGGVQGAGGTLSLHCRCVKIVGILMTTGQPAF